MKECYIELLHVLGRGKVLPFGYHVRDYDKALNARPCVANAGCEKVQGAGYEDLPQSPDSPDRSIRVPPPSAGEKASSKYTFWWTTSKASGGLSFSLASLSLLLFLWCDSICADKMLERDER